MEKIRITKSFSFETAHALYNYDGKCKNVHGHNYKLFVTIIGEPIDDIENPKNGMVMDFGDLKTIIKKEILDDFDHVIVLNALTPHKNLADVLHEYSSNVVLVDYQPTCEMMIIDFANRIMKSLPIRVQLHSLKLYETDSSYSEWQNENI